MGNAGLPWWSSSKESTFQCKGPQFDPWSGEILHASWQLSPQAATPEPMGHNYWSLGAQSPCSATQEATTMRSPSIATGESPLLTATRESPHNNNNKAMKTQRSQKEKKKKPGLRETCSLSHWGLRKHVRSCGWARQMESTRDSGRSPVGAVQGRGQQRTQKAGSIPGSSWE